MAVNKTISEKAVLRQYSNNNIQQHAYCYPDIRRVQRARFTYCVGVLNRVKAQDWRVSIACPAAKVRSMNGVAIEAQATLEEACEADAVIFGSGIYTREVVEDHALMSRLKFDPTRQLLAAQCSATLILAKLGLLNGAPACTDLTTKSWVIAAGVDVLNQPFFANGRVATAGGCLASHYLAAWLIARLQGVEAAKEALYYVAPVGEKEEYVKRGLRNIMPYMPEPVGS